MHRFRSEDGAAQNAWVVQLVVVLAFFGLIGTELFKLASAGLGADEAAAVVLDAAERSLRTGARLPAIREVAQASAEGEGVSLFDLTLDENFLEVTVQRTADTLIIHRFAADASWVNPSATRRTSARP